MTIMQNWEDLYNELGTIIDQVAAIEWIDLWHNQVSFLDDEHPFPTPAVFLAFRSNKIDDQGVKTQQVNLQVDVYLYFETFADTYKGGVNQGSAMAFLKSLDQINALLHGSSGNNYSSMRRTSFGPVDTGGAGNLYQATYECLLIDYSAQKTFADGTFKELEIGPKDGNGFIV